MSPIEQIDALIAKWEKKAGRKRLFAQKLKSWCAINAADDFEQVVEDLKALREALAQKPEKEN